MSSVVGFVAMSHAPFWDGSIPVDGPGEDFVSGVESVRQSVLDAKPDLVVVFGPDHVRNFFYDLMPPFCIGVGEVNGFGDYGTRGGAVPTVEGYGQSILEFVRESGFDPAFSLRMGVDHGIIQSYDVLSGDRDIPILPIMIDCAAPPTPSFRRAFEFGQAVGEAVRAMEDDRKVLFVASGGLSHWVAISDPRAVETSAEMREYLIDGRDTVREYNAQRERSLAQRQASGTYEGRINTGWDRAFLKMMRSGEIDAILSQNVDEVAVQAGNGARETLCWVAGCGAWGQPLSVDSYEPVPSWSTGMGLVAGFSESEAY